MYKMSISISELKQTVMKIISDDIYDQEDLKQILYPVVDYTKNSSFVKNIEKIVAIITEDRDGNHIFTFNDLVLLKNDMNGITSLIMAIILFIGAIPGLQLKYKEGESEQIILKVLIYIFLVIIPKETKIDFSVEIKEQILNIVIGIYDFIISSQIIKNLFIKIGKWFKFNTVDKVVSCITAKTETTSKEEVVDKMLPKLEVELKSSIAHKNNIMKATIEDLKINHLLKK
jgi:hypothetical protein